MFSRPFGKLGIIPLATYMQIHNKGYSVDIKGIATIQKGMPHKHYHGKMKSTMLPSMLLALL